MNSGQFRKVYEFVDDKDIKHENLVQQVKIVLSAHTIQMIEKRKILEHEAHDTVRYPDKIQKEYGKYYYQKKFERGTIEAVCERTANHIKIITIYWI